MPHQCVRCSRIYPDGSTELLQGCNCGGKFFFFVKERNIEEARKITENLTIEDKKQIEKDVLDIVGEKIDRRRPIVLDLESIKILKPGKYELDLVDIFRGKPLVYKLEDGKYIIDIASTFQAKELNIPKEDEIEIEAKTDEDEESENVSEEKSDEEDNDNNEDKQGEEDDKDNEDDKDEEQEEEEE